MTGRANFDISKLNVAEQIRSDHVISVVGRRGSGKSVIMLDILYRKRNCFHCGMVISPTEDGNFTWRDVVPPAYIHTRYDGDLVMNFFHRQEKLAAEISIAYRRRHGRDIFQIQIFDKYGLVVYEAGVDPVGYLCRGNIVIHGHRHHKHHWHYWHHRCRCHKHRHW